MKQIHGDLKNVRALLPCAGACLIASRGKIYVIFLSFFELSSVLKLLGSLDKFSRNCIVFKNLPSTIDLHYSSPLILHAVSCFTELHDLSLKRVKTLMELHDLEIIQIIITWMKMIQNVPQNHKQLNVMTSYLKEITKHIAENIIWCFDISNMLRNREKPSLKSNPWIGETLLTASVSFI